MRRRRRSTIETVDAVTQIEKTYRDYQIEFFEDYDRENPISAKKATE